MPLACSWFAHTSLTGNYCGDMRRWPMNKSAASSKELSQRRLRGLGVGPGHPIWQSAEVAWACEEKFGEPMSVDQDRMSRDAVLTLAKEALETGSIPLALKNVLGFKGDQATET